MSLHTRHAENSAAAKPAKAVKVRGNMKPAEINPLVITARQAFDFQRGLGNIDDGETFDAWRQRQCHDAVGKPGISSCNHEDFRPLKAHFEVLLGKDAEAFDNLVTGTADHEKRRQMAHQIGELIAAHVHLAETPEATLEAEAAAEWYSLSPTIPFAGLARDIRDRKAAIEAKGKGPITAGYVVFLARQKTRRPDLTLGKDWQAGLADRCDLWQLTQIRNTVVNRINATEGVGSNATRNRSQASKAAKRPRSPHELDDRRW